MIPIIYESTETAFTTNGLGRLRDCISAVCVEERNGVYETDIEYPVGGANYELIKIGRIIGVTHDDTGTVEPFDIVSMDRPINGVVTVHCVHISYRLTGITTWAKNINSLAAALGVFNNISGNPFTFSADFTSGAYMAAFDGIPRTVRQLMGGVEGSILDAYGGEWEFSGYHAILHRSRGQMRDFAIRYGVNMLDYDESIDYEGAYNSCVPYWAGTDDKGASVVVRGSRVDSGQMLPNGRRVVAPLDLSEKFEEKPTAAQLQTMAASVMNARRPYLPAQNIKVDFIRLQDFTGYEDFAALLQCNLCDTINVVFPAYETQAPFKIVKTTWDILDGKYTEMELGQLSTTLSEALGITGGGTFTETNGPTEAAEYIIETGDAGNFHYTKYNTGRVVAIGYVTFSSLTFTASNGHYRSVSNAFTIPSGIFSAAPQHTFAWIQGANTVYFAATIGGATATGGNCEIWKSTSGNATNVSVHMRLEYTP